MPFTIVRDDITHVRADAIVNAANEQLMRGGGVCGAIFKAAGARKLQAACDKIGHCDTGQSVATPAFSLHARYIIHTVGPIWRGGTQGEPELLASCYRTSLELASSLGCESIAFPLISAGIYGYPKHEALATARREIRSFLASHEMDVTLVLYDTGVMQLAGNLKLRVKRYIDDVYVGEHAPLQSRPVWEMQQLQSVESASLTSAEEAPLGRLDTVEKVTHCPHCGHPIMGDDAFCISCGYDLRKHTEAQPTGAFPPISESMAPTSAEPITSAPMSAGSARPHYAPQADYSGSAAPSMAPSAPREAAPKQAGRTAADERKGLKLPSSLRNLLSHLDASFSETLLAMIDERGLRDAQVYKRANLSRQHFSKIRSNPRYKPTKTTVLALAVALELSLDETSMLLERAGFALSHADYRDVIVEFFIREGIYDVFQINDALFAFDQPLLG